jgi:hypothetical protein
MRWFRSSGNPDWAAGIDPKRALRHQPRGFRMMPTADVKETSCAATIELTRKNRENA